MSCNPHKDLSALRAKMRFSYGRLLLEAYLWESKEALHAATKIDTCDAACCHMPTFMTVDAKGAVTTKTTPKRGELHFASGSWNMECVAHECLHASMGMARAMGAENAYDLNPQGKLSFVARWYVETFCSENPAIDCDEELLCYLHGELVHAVYGWLWNNDKTPWELP